MPKFRFRLEDCLCEIDIIQFEKRNNSSTGIMKVGMNIHVFVFHEMGSHEWKKIKHNGPTFEIRTIQDLARVFANSDLSELIRLEAVKKEFLDQ
jgi:hypothetical protein